MKRDIIKIDGDRCTGCGLCIPNCPEGALQVIDGKARLISDLSCDGLGACIGHCPEGAITIETREAEPYDERKVMDNIAKAGPNVIRAHLDHLRGHGQDRYFAEAIAYLKERHIGVPAPAPPAPGPGEPEVGTFACPGTKMMDLRANEPADVAPAPARRSLLGQWPVQLHLLNPQAPYFRGADLLVAADCVPFASADFHERFLAGKALVVFCPKLDDSDEIYVERLAEIIRLNDIKSITVVHMEVPCCFGTNRIVEEALKRSGKKLEVKDITISVRGEVKNA